jgi:hypothetical protein
MKEKLKCKICGLLFEKIRSISNHVCKKHKIILRDYYDKFFKVNKNEGLCKICRKPTTFYSLRFGYATYCCPKCGYSDEEAKKERNSLIKISHNKPESIEKNRNITLNLWKNEKFRQNAMDKNVETKKKMVKTKKNKMKEDDHYLYNLELESNEDKDDLFWIEQNSKMVSHNCFPKDLKSFIYWCDSNNFEYDILKVVDEVNERVREHKDWLEIKGATSDNNYC